jgi:hypothetical protein
VPCVELSLVRFGLPKHNWQLATGLRWPCRLVGSLAMATADAAAPPSDSGLCVPAPGRMGVAPFSLTMEPAIPARDAGLLAATVLPRRAARVGPAACWFCVCTLNLRTMCSKDTLLAGTLAAGRSAYATAILLISSHTYLMLPPQSVCVCVCPPEYWRHRWRQHQAELCADLTTSRVDCDGPF